MTNQEYSFIEGFVKRASEYGYNEIEAIEMLKSASPETLAMAPGARTAAQAANNPVHAVQPAPPPGVPAVSLASLDSRNRGNAAPPVAPIKVPRQHLDEALMQPGQRSFTSPR